MPLEDMGLVTQSPLTTLRGGLSNLLISGLSSRSVWRSGCTVAVCVLRFWEGSDHCKQASKFLHKLLAVR